MKRLHSIATIALTGLMGLSALSAPMAASASEEDKRNTTYALGAAALGLLLTQHNKLPGILAAGGAAYAYSQYDKDIQARHRRERDGYDDNRRNRWQTEGDRYRQDNTDNGYRYGQNDVRDNCDQDNSGRYDRNNYGSGYRQDNRLNYRDNGVQTYRNNHSNAGWNNWNSSHRSVSRDRRPAH